MFGFGHDGEPELPLQTVMEFAGEAIAAVIGDCCEPAGWEREAGGTERRRR